VEVTTLDGGTPGLRQGGPRQGGPPQGAPARYRAVPERQVRV